LENGFASKIRNTKLLNIFNKVRTRKPSSIFLWSLCWAIWVSRKNDYSLLYPKRDVHTKARLFEWLAELEEHGKKISS